MKKRPPLFLLVAPAALVLAAIVFAFNSKLSAEAWAAVAAFMAVGVGLIAAFVAWHQIESTEKGAHLAVQPHCLVIAKVDNATSQPPGIFLRNNGLGPGIVVEWRFFRGGKLMADRNQDGLDALLNSYELKGLVEGMLLSPGDSIGTNQTEPMFYVPEFYSNLIARGSSTANETMHLLLKEVNVVLIYKSVYEDEARCSSLPLPKESITAS